MSVVGGIPLPLPKLPKGSAVGWPSWSHDSLYVFFWASDGNIYKAPISGGTAELAARTAGIDFTIPGTDVGAWFGLTPDDRILVMIDRSVTEVYAPDVKYR